VRLSQYPEFDPLGVDLFTEIDPLGVDLLILTGTSTMRQYYLCMSCALSISYQ
jgi:hypothetical protein